MEAVDINIFIDDKLKSSDVYKEGDKVWMDFNNLDDCLTFVWEDYKKIKSISYGGKDAVLLAETTLRYFSFVTTKHPNIYIHSKSKKTIDSIIDLFKDYNNK